LIVQGLRRPADLVEEIVRLLATVWASSYGRRKPKRDAGIENRSAAEQEARNQEEVLWEWFSTR